MGNEKKINISYPFELIDKRKNFPSNHVIPCSVLVDNEEIGGIFIVCPSKDMKYFNISPSPPPNPPIKFRMLNSDKKIFVVEIWMLFRQNPEKCLKMHFNPHDLNVQKFLKLGTKTEGISRTDRMYKYFTQNNDDFFVREGAMHVMLHDISKLN